MESGPSQQLIEKAKKHGKHKVLSKMKRAVYEMLSSDTQLFFGDHCYGVFPRFLPIASVEKRKKATKKMHDKIQQKARNQLAYEKTAKKEALDLLKRLADDFEKQLDETGFEDELAPELDDEELVGEFVEDELEEGEDKKDGAIEIMKMEKGFQ